MELSEFSGRRANARSDGQFRSGEFEDNGVHSQAIAWLGIDLLDRAVDLRAQDVLHLHRFHNRDRLAGLDFLALFHSDRNDETGHRAKHFLAGVGNLSWRHQAGIAGFPLGIDIGHGFDAPMAQGKPVRYVAHLHRHRLVIERPAPDWIARLPVRCQAMLAAPVSMHADMNRAVYPLDLELDFPVAEPDGTLTFPGDRPAAQLSGNAPLALPKDMINRGGNGRQHLAAPAFRRLRVKSAAELFCNEPGRKLARLPARMSHHCGEKGHVMANAVDDECIKRIALRGDCPTSRRGMRDELRDYRIVVERDFTAFKHAGVIAHRCAVDRSLLRRTVARQPSRRGKKIPVRILGIDSAFDGPAIALHVALLDRKLFSCRYADHLLDQIDAGDKLGDRMLDLQARIHLQEIKAFVLPGDKLDRTGAVVTDGLGKRDRLLPHLLARCCIEQWTGCLLDHLLIAALDRAFALAEVDDISMFVAEHLDFDVTRVGDKFFDKDALVAE